MEEKILSEVHLLQSEIPVTHWENWTFQYSRIDKEDFLHKIKRAFAKVIFQPPKEPWDE